MSIVHVLHELIVAIYLVLPAAVLVAAIAARVRRGRRGPLRRMWLAICGGIVISSAVCVASAAVTGGRPILSQALLAAYFATGLLLLTRGFDRLLWFVTTWTLGLRRSNTSRWIGTRVVVAGLLRAAVLFGVGLPYFLAAALTYRPHLRYQGDPQSILHRPFEDVSFSSSDGMRLAGWWIEAESPPSRRTVLLCHGWAAGKASQLFVVRRLVDDGYNVLSFDFRGHGQSSGNLVGFGDTERRDVLAAVHWLAATHPAECQRLMGLGINTGGAALLAASIDPGADGQRIDAVAVCGTFDTLANEARALAQENFPHPALRPLSWLAVHVGLPLAGVQLDAAPSFSPAAAIAQLWPRPVLVVHGVDDEMVPLERGEALFEAAYPPRRFYWVEHEAQDTALHDAGASKAIEHFFNTARTLL